MSNTTAHRNTRRETTGDETPGSDTTPSDTTGIDATGIDVSRLTPLEHARVARDTIDWSRLLKPPPTLDPSPVTEDQAIAQLNSLGYTPHGRKLDRLDDEAVRLYQARNNLRVTGQLDPATLRQLGKRRCGFPDLDNGIDFTTRGTWDHTNITFAFEDGTNDVAGSAESDAVRRAFATWQSYCSLRFTEVAASASPDILIDWRDAHDPDHSMVGTVLAHADFPPGFGVINNTMPRPLHFDDSEETWCIGAVAGQFDVETIALHEIGHLIGLAHSTVAGSVMWPSVSDNFTQHTPQADDLAGLGTLYPLVPQGSGDTLWPNQALYPNTQLHSGSGRYTLVYQGDGNLVLYDQGRALWASGTDGSPAAMAVMQTDGNLVVYSPGQRPRWASNTDGQPGNRLVVQNDGNIVIYRPDNSVAWSPNTWVQTTSQGGGDRLVGGQMLAPDTQLVSNNGRFRFVYQGDGNAVVYDGNRPLWASNTDGTQPGNLCMQSDGNLVAYRHGGYAYWASNTDGRYGSCVVMQDDGNLVIYDTGWRPRWASNTNIA